MAVMYSFCKYFSVRLGTILVAVSSMIQSLIIGILLLVWLNNIRQTCEKIEDWSSTNKLNYVSDLFQSMELYTSFYLKSAFVFLLLHISTCGLLIYAALKCNIPLIWPYLVVEFVRLAVISLVHFTGMMFIKENILDLGLLIGLSLSGGFLLLGLYYKWFCVISLCQCIQKLRENPMDQMKPTGVNLLVSDFKHLSKDADQRHYLSVSPSWGLQPVHNLQNRDYYGQHGNMAWPTN